MATTKATKRERPGVMPIGQTMGMPIRPEDVKTPGDGAAPIFTENARAEIIWSNYNEARNYVENNAWLLEWQETDILYQSPIPNRFVRVENGRPARVPEFLVAKISRTLARAIKRGLFAEQYPFFLRPTGKTSQAQIDAWSALIGKLLKRMKFKYWVGLLINCQVVQGTGIGRMVWQTKEVIYKTRKRKAAALKSSLPTGDKYVSTKESDDFTIERDTKTESWPCFEYRRLGTTLFDPKWCTPDEPDESAGYAIDIDYVNFYDLQEMRKLDCYKNIPDDATLKAWLCYKQQGAAPVGSQIEDSMSNMGSVVVHAEGRNRQTDRDPLRQPIMLIEQWDTKTVGTILVYDGRRLLIRDEEHYSQSSCHVSATWWPIDNSGYGMGIGRVNGPDQRVKQGVKNESLKMIAYPFNAPLVTALGHNAPTQNVIARMGGFWALDAPPGTDYRKSVGFLEMPPVPPDAWRMLDVVQKSAEELSGANSPFQQGNLPGPGSSAARTAAGVNRISSMSDQSVADPIDSVAQGVIVHVIEWLVDQVREKMPLWEIREILSEKHAAVIEGAIYEDAFVNATFDVDVLAGALLAARQGIQNLIPFFMQLAQQPQLLEYLHQRGETIDFGVIEDLLMQVSELTQQPDIFRALTPRERAMLRTMNPGAQKIQQATAVEQVRGKNRLAEIDRKGQVDLANTAAEKAIDKTSEGLPFDRATGLFERSQDENVLKSGFPDFTQ